MPQLNDTWKLIEPMSGVEITPGETITDFRDQPHVFHAITKVPDGSSQGKIQVGGEFGPEYYPSVFRLKIVPRAKGLYRQQVYAGTAAGQTAEVPTEVLDTLYRALDALYGSGQGLTGAAYRDAQAVLDDLAQSAFTVRADADDDN
jgi:hypothetical protein